jgi:hypothetical protein
MDWTSIRPFVNRVAVIMADIAGARSGRWRWGAAETQRKANRSGSRLACEDVRRGAGGKGELQTVASEWNPHVRMCVVWREDQSGGKIMASERQ